MVWASVTMLQHTPEIGALSREMRSVIEKLAERSRVYVLDLLGFGLSDRPDIHYSCDVYVTLCQDFLKLVMANDDTVHAIVDRARDTAASMNDVTGVVATDYTIEDETRVTEISSKGQALDEQVTEGQRNVNQG